MTVSEELDQAWSAVSAERHGADGIYERRVLSHSSTSLFAALAVPTLRRILIAELDKRLIKARIYRVTRAFQVDTESLGAGRVRVFIRQTSQVFDDLFKAMCSDIADGVAKARTESLAADWLVRRLEHWCRFAEKAITGLSTGQQVGLFAELWFMSMLLERMPAADAVQGWVGPLGANHDFMFGAVGVEVKATTAVEDTAVIISNERQLDTTGTNRLYLAHYSFDQRPGSGISLPHLVKRIESQLSPEFTTEFRDRLLCAGYVAAHEPLYVSSGYTPRRDAIYIISEEFPRLVPNLLPLGVHTVSYTVELSAGANCAVDKADLINRITG